MKRFELTLASRPDEINRALNAVDSFGESCDLAPALVRVLGLIVEELALNSVTHGGMPGDALIKISIVEQNNHLLLRYEDSGRMFNPNTDLPPDTRHRQLEERPVGGLGWALIFYYARSVDYRREANRNVYELRVSVT